MAPKKRLGEMLVEAGALSEDDLGRALELQKNSGRKLGTVLMQEGLLTEASLLDVLRRQLNVDVVSSGDLVVDDAAWKRVSEDLIKRYTVLPLRIQGRELTLAMSDPFNIMAIDDLKFATGCIRIKVVLAAESSIESIIQERLKAPTLMSDILDHGDLYRKALEMIDTNQVPDLPVEEVREEPISAHTIEVESESPPIISLVNFLFIEAFKRKASDIHIEPYQTSFRVRYRIDGVLYTILTPPPRLQMYIISRIKILAGMDISKRMIPQDGHLALKIQGENIHFRVSTLPTVYGEKCVMRMIRKQKMLEDVDALGFAPEVVALYKRIIKVPQGMILFTGPTGSGKTTTLYASLNHINTPDINIITLEDPVESTLYGINHVQIRHGHGLEFTSGLRAILRQDPDVIFVGEIRDGEVAEIAMQAAMTGHLVFSTLHANSTHESFERLADMGVEPYLISSTVLGIVAQRLLRRVCPDCRAPYEPSVEEVEEFELDAAYLENAKLQKGAGCQKCMNTGYQGRVAAYEVLFMNSQLRALVKQRAGAAAIRKAFVEAGTRTILADGLDKVRRGITTLDEVRRALVAGAEMD
jgi:type IV pilus assembly protein PilB